MQTVFSTCVSWILTPPPTSPKTPRSFCNPLGRWRKRIILTPAPNSVVTSLHSSSHWTAFLGSRQRRQWKLLPKSSHKSGTETTHGLAGAWKVGLWSLFSGQFSTVSGGQGFGLSNKREMPPVGGRSGPTYLWVKKEGHAPPSSSYASLFTSPFRIELGKVIRTSGTFPRTWYLSSRGVSVTLIGIHHTSPMGIS